MKRFVSVHFVFEGQVTQPTTDCSNCSSCDWKICFFAALGNLTPPFLLTYRHTVKKAGYVKSLLIWGVPLHEVRNSVNWKIQKKSVRISELRAEVLTRDLRKKDGWPLDHEEDVTSRETDTNSRDRKARGGGKPVVSAVLLTRHVFRVTEKTRSWKGARIVEFRARYSFSDCTNFVPRQHIWLYGIEL